VCAAAVVVTWRRDGAAEPVRIPARDVPFSLLEGPGQGAGVEPPGGNGDATLFFSYQDALVAAPRSLPKDASADDVLELLFAGPTPDETAAGLSSSLGPTAEVTGVAVADGRAAVNLSGPLAEGPDGADRSLGLAQIVFTLTELPGVDDVRFLLDGDAVEVPIGDGTLTRDAVTRSDYPVTVIALPLDG
jgi:hypothetical protein